MPVLPVLEDHLEVTDPEFASHIDDFRRRPKLLKCIESAPALGRDRICSYGLFFDVGSGPTWDVG
jgi:hypothetical protein